MTPVETQISPPTQEHTASQPAALPAEVVAAPEDWGAAGTARRARRVNRKLMLVLAVLALLAAGAYAGIQRLMNRAPEGQIQLFEVTRRSFPIILQEKGELKAANSIEIRSEIEGRATIIYLIEEGARVEKGDLLVELASDVIDETIREAEIKEATAAAAYEAAVKERDILRDENASKIRKAELDLTLARLAEEKYIKGDKEEQLQTAQLNLDKAKSVLARAEETYRDSQELFEQGFITRVDLENDRFEEYSARLELQKAELALKVLEEYTIKMDLQEKASAVHEAEKELDRTRKAAEASEAKANAEVDAKKAELDLVREKLAKARDQKNKSKILAPSAGLVVYARESRWDSDSEIKTGVQVHERQWLIELPDTRRMKVELAVHEAKIEQLELGLPATVEIEGFTGRTFTGRVSRIGVMADSQNRWMNPDLKQYKTEVLLDGEFTELKPNITARAKIQVAYLNDVLAVPVQSVFAKGHKFYVFVDDGDSVRPVEVEPGMSSSEYVEIKQGLQPGQRIRLAVSDEMKLLLPEQQPGAVNGEAGNQPGIEPTEPGGRGDAAERERSPETARPGPAADRQPGADAPADQDKQVPRPAAGAAGRERPAGGPGNASQRRPGGSGGGGRRDRGGGASSGR